MQPEISYENYFRILSKKLSDPRDNRGKCHNLAFICCCVIIAIMNGRLYPTSIQRYINNRHDDLCEQIGYESSKAISLSQLLRLMRLVNWESWNSINIDFFNRSILVEKKEQEGGQWQAIDGKELRGSIEPGNTRGLNVVRSIGQDDKIVLAQKYYDGSKESEKLEVRQIVSEEAKGKKVSFDALHCEPQTLGIIESNEGKYIVQVKGNQELMVAELEAVSRYLPVQGVYKTYDKGHGRAESRVYESYDLRHPLFEGCLDGRWAKCKINSLIVCHRKFTTIKTAEVEEQTSLYISNDTHRADDTEQLKTKEWGDAIRNHWAIESDHFVRDVTFKEDFLRIKSHRVQKIMSVCISAAVMLFREINVTNFQAATEAFSDNPITFFDKLRRIKFL